MQLAPVAIMRIARQCTMAVNTMLDTRLDATSNTSDAHFAASRTYLDTYTLYASTTHYLLLKLQFVKN